MTAEIIPLTKAIQQHRERRDRPRFKKRCGVCGSNETRYRADFGALGSAYFCEKCREDIRKEAAFARKFESDNLRVRPWKPSDDDDPEVA